MRRTPWRAVALVTLTVAVGGALVAEAAAPSLDTPPTAGALADPVSRVGVDAVSITQVGMLSQATIEAAMLAADDANAAAVLGHGFQVGMSGVYRGGVAVNAAQGPGWRFPVNATALPNSAISALIGRSVSAQIGFVNVVVGAGMAAMHNVQAGDELEVYANSGGLARLLVRSVQPDDVLGGTEIMMGNDMAQLLGSAGPSRVLIWGPRSREAIDAALAARGIVNYAATVRVRRTWEPPDPDSTLGLLSTKQLLGEPQYRPIAGSDNITLEAGWVAASIPGDSGRLLNGYVRNSCHNRIVADLQAALNEVDAAGLTAALRGPYAEAGIGGCFNPRFNRNTPSDNLGSLSRHTWAQAMDINTIANCQGCIPPMNCDVVRIFRAHNFAWGGNFPRPDGMHFEWVGSRRDQLQYPSRLCPNLPAVVVDDPAVQVDGFATIFAGDAWLHE
jgi:D-alanyl-D-alanine carboxypeptidase